MLEDVGALDDVMGSLDGAIGAPDDATFGLEAIGESV